MPGSAKNREIQKTDFRKYLTSTRDFWGKYRDGKENALWLATTVYLGALAAFDSFILQPSYTVSLLLKILIGVLVITTSFLAYMYIKSLIRDRRYASDIISHCDSLMTRLLDPEFELDRKFKFIDTYKDTSKLLQSLENFVSELGAPDWTWSHDKNKWNLWSPLGVVIIWTIVAVVLICLR